MKIKLNGTVRNARGVFEAGSEVDWPKATAQPLVKAGHAIEADGHSALFASNKAAALAKELGVEDAVYWAGGGSGKDGRHTVADVKALAGEGE